MKFLYFFVFTLFFSCTKSLEERCFTKGEEKSSYVEEKPYTVKQILEEKPDYLEIINLKKFRDFKQDSSEYRTKVYNLEANEKRWKDQKVIFADFDQYFFGQFEYSFKTNDGNIKYALGRNGLGYWLLEIKNNQPFAYFLGLSFSHYYFNKIQDKPIVKDGFFQIEGSLVKIVKVAGLPGYDDYSAIEDGKLFKINLKDLLKDSDKDGFNDIFEKSFGLNPKNKDTDGDGVNDFDDTNPMFRSEKNKFSELYQRLLPEYAGAPDFKNMHYYFEVFETDCDYFHQVNPDYRILFASDEKNKQTNYIKVTNVFHHGISKIKKHEKDPKRFYIYTWGSGSTNDYSAEYKNGKWIFKLIGGTVS
ncbi:hypothetical protein [Chryseobacterium sp. ERMR1:04]|uniref:hypothetical protein n=1 Tax=Chryseobacterium sp. ERMR1:04 TaxID=1705393 RepID=UPI0006C890F3|nr:hypothetical protein [Chryseobacterium sp. ERMR1:04]KPH14622.1 hypothetical protein AMQ68_03960 [Chryseobacterium sp. ERMR1:04]